MKESNYKVPLLDDSTMTAYCRDATLPSHASIFGLVVL